MYSEEQSYGQVAYDVPEDSRQVHTQISYLQESVSILSNTVDELLKRLDHVVSPELSSVHAEGGLAKAMDAPLSPVSGNIRQEVTRIRRVQSSVVNVLDRLEI